MTADDTMLRVDFTIDRRPYALDIPTHGRDVCGWAAAGDWTRILPGAITTRQRRAFAARLQDIADPLGMEACRDIAEQLAEDIYGLPWHAASRLAGTAETHWGEQFAPWCITVGFDPDTATPQRLTAAILAWVRAGYGDEKDATRTEAKIFAPPKDALRRRSPAAEAAEQAAFFRQVQALPT